MPAINTLSRAVQSFLALRPRSLKHRMGLYKRIKVLHKTDGINSRSAVIRHKLFSINTPTAATRRIYKTLLQSTYRRQSYSLTEVRRLLFKKNTLLHNRFFQKINHLNKRNSFIEFRYVTNASNQP